MIPHRRFTTRVVAGKDQFRQWQNAMAPLMELHWPAARSPSDTCVVDAGTFDLGPLLIVAGRFDGVFARRSKDTIRQGCFDHLLLVFLRQGSIIGKLAGESIRMSAGTGLIGSLASPLELSIDSTEVISIVFERDACPELAATIDRFTNTVLSDRMSSFIGAFLSSIVLQLPNLSAADAPTIVNSIAAFIDACLAQSAARTTDPRVTIWATQFKLACKCINEHLSSLTLTPALVARAAGVSLRQLYYLFECQGGVVKYIRRRRLQACHAAIADPHEPRRIQTIAYSYGFSDPAQFSKAFRAEFGYSPRDARATPARWRLPPERPRTIIEWFARAPLIVGGRLRARTSKMHGATRNAD